MLKVTLDETEINDTPKEWRNFSVQLIRDYAERIIRYKYPTELTFYGDGYEYLKKQIDLYGYDRAIPVSIQGDLDGSTIFTGSLTLFLTDTTTDHYKGEIKVILKDNNYIARIDNNKRIKVAANVRKTKTTNATIARTYAINLAMFDGEGEFYNSASSNFIHKTVRSAVDLKDAFTNLISFYTDNKVGFASSWYDNLGYGICLIRGAEVRLGTTNTGARVPNISFWELWQDISRIYNLWLVMDISDTENPVIRIEQESYIYDSESLVKVEEVTGTLEKYEQSLLYSKIRFGSSVLTEPGDPANLNRLALAGFQSEEYYLETDVNIDEELDLTVANGVIDNNTFLTLLEDANASDQYDDNTFYCAYDIGTESAILYNFYGLGAGTQYFYNEPFNNLEISKRYQLYDTITSQIDDQRSLDLITTAGSIIEANKVFFSAQTRQFIENCEAADYTYRIDGVQYPNESIDAASAWSVDTYTSTVIGMYTFKVTTSARVITYKEPSDRYDEPKHNTYLKITRTGGAVEYSTIGRTYNLPTMGGVDAKYYDTGVYQSVNGFAVWLNVGDTVQVIESLDDLGDICHYRQIQFIIGEASGIEVLKHPLSGITLPAADPNVLRRGYFISTQRYKKGLTKEQVKLILENPTKSVILQRSQGQESKTWIKNANVNLLTGVADIESISNIDNR